MMVKDTSVVNGPSLLELHLDRPKGLRILQVASGLRCLAGTEKHVLDISVALAKRGYAVTLACPHDCPLAHRATELGVQKLTLEMQGANEWKQLPSFVRAMAGKFDVVHTHSTLDY